jgi:hypothetical protein
MRLTRLRGGNSQFPEEKQPGDVVVLALGDIFCWDGGIWQLVGGRFLPQAMREDFLNYVASGWPDEDSAKFDLPTLFDLQIFVDYLGEEEYDPEKTQKWIDKFISRVLEVARRLDGRAQ